MKIASVFALGSSIRSRSGLKKKRLTSETTIAPSTSSPKISSRKERTPFTVVPTISS